MKTKIREALEAKRAEAQVKWTAFDELRKAMSENGFDPLKDKEGFEKAHEAHKEYALVRDEADELQKAWEKAVEMDGEIAPRKTPFSDDEDGGSSNGHKDLERLLSGLYGIEANGKTAGEIFAGSDQVKSLRESGVLSV